MEPATASGRFDLSGRVAVVTGASEGIGRGLALGLARAGADLVICGRRETALNSVAGEVGALGRRAVPIVVDVRDPDQVAALRSRCAVAFKRVAILVNCAGFYVETPAWSLTSREWDGIIDTGLKGTFLCCQQVGALMREHGYGKIINLSSTFSRRVWPGLAAYAAQKAAVSHLTEALAVEWAADGIRVNALAPTAIRTPSRETSMQGDELSALVSHIPLGRVGTVDDLLGAAIFLASAASDFVTGHTLFVDGGYSVAD